mmetsp:Transcript_46603/g.118175  ORF Transcript_46603/g.118175 Transcript_46603/m.118175 type:complete len:221 (-) Transcript_46603:77-739(-)
MPTQPLQKTRKLVLGAPRLVAGELRAIPLAMAMHAAKSNAAQGKAKTHRQHFDNRIRSSRVAEDANPLPIDPLASGELRHPGAVALGQLLPEVALHPPPGRAVVDEPPPLLRPHGRGQHEGLGCHTLELVDPIQDGACVLAEAREVRRQRIWSNLPMRVPTRRLDQNGAKFDIAERKRGPHLEHVTGHPSRDRRVESASPTEIVGRLLRLPGPLAPVLAH